PDLVRSEPELHRVQAVYRYPRIFQAVVLALRLAEFERFPADGAAEHYRNLAQRGRRRRPRHLSRNQGVHGPIFRGLGSDGRPLRGAKLEPAQWRADRDRRSYRGTPLL